MRIALTLAVTTSALLFVGLAEAARLTPTQAAAKVEEATHDVYRTGIGGAPTTCVRVGAKVNGQRSAFRCSVTYRLAGSEFRTSPVWLRVRPKGGACVSLTSLATVPADCLRASSAVAAPDQDPGSEVRRLMQQRFFPDKPGLWQSFTKLDCVGADGWYQCAFGEGVAGSATVVFVRSGPRTRLTSLSCLPEVAAKFPAACAAV